jgi:hypothetical protein
LLAAPAVAVADKSGSSNWSGYAVHRAGTTFSHITGSWRQPQGSCAAGGPTYSAYWVGIGGYAQNSTGIEQLGTEFDCSAGGHAKLSAWYELLPAPVRRISMTVAPGDQMAGGVAIAGNEVTLTLQDLTRNESFSRTIFDGKIDPSSAEWITEAPSECAGAYHCEALPLTDFGSVTFSAANAETSTGETGSISSPLWRSTQIVLARAAQYVSVSTKSAVREARPSPLRDGGQSFTVAFAQSGARSSAPAGSKGSAGGGTVSPDGGSATGAGSGYGSAAGRGWHAGRG